MNRETLLVALVAAVAVAAFGVGAATLDGALGPSEPETPGESETGAVGGLGAESAADSQAPTSGSCVICPSGGFSLTTTGLVPALSRSVVLGLAGLGAVVTGLIWLRAGRGTDASTGDAGVSDDGLDATGDAGSTATWTADDPPASNPVYRAWRDVADALDPGDPETTTPGEYAVLARERGWNETAVDTLTALFSRVRYGQADVTDERAERARTAAERAREITDSTGAGDSAPEDRP